MPTNKLKKDTKRSVTASKTTPSAKAEREKLVVGQMVTPTTSFTRQLAAEIVKNLTQLRERTERTFEPLRKQPVPKVKGEKPVYEHPVIADTSVLIDGRIVPIVNSGFFIGTVIIPQFVLGEVQHIADSADALRRAKGRRGLDVVTKLKDQKVNPAVTIQIVSEEVPEAKEVDHKLVALAKSWSMKLLTVDFNLAQVARAQGVKILNINDLGQALKVALMPGEEMTIKITHEGKERSQGVGYLPDGTMVVVEDTRNLVGQDVIAIVTKVHQTPAGQLFFARLR
jgi:uncharacterized protein YacL